MKNNSEQTNSYLLQEGTKKLKLSNIISAALDSRILLSHATSSTTEELLLNSNNTHPPSIIKKFFELIKRRASHEPIAYIIEHKEFYGINFEVDKNVLIPRPDSETLIDLSKLYFNQEDNFSILDLGTGSGCLLLTLLNLFPNSTGTAVDISNKALSIAKKNAAALQLSNRASFINSDWSNLDLKSKFDLIISNPPYIENNEINFLQEDVKNFEPLTALAGGEDGLDCYRNIFLNLKNNLSEDGKLIFEIGAGQFDSISKLAEQHGFELHKSKKDLPGIIRAVSFVDLIIS